MPPVSAKVAARIVAGLKQFQPVLTGAKTRDVNESDTAILVTDMLAEIFGYAKYSEITSEHSIRSTFCDLAGGPTLSRSLKTGHRYAPLVRS